MLILHILSRIMLLNINLILKMNALRLNDK